MTSTTLACLLGMALAWAALDALRKVVGGRLDVVSALLWLTALQIPLFALWLAIDDSTPVRSTYWLISAGVLAANLLSNLMFLRAVQIAPLSQTVPYLSLTPVFTVAVGALTLGEWPTAWQMWGIGLVLAGAIALDPRVLRAKQVDAAVWLMIGVSVLWAFNAVLDKVAVQASSPALHGMIQMVALSVLIAAWLRIRGQLGHTWRVGLGSSRTLIATGLVAALAMGLQLVALSLTLASIVEVVKRAIGLAMAVILGRALFGEPFTARKWTSVALMGIGTFFVLGFAG